YLGLHPDVSASEPKELDFFLAGKNWPRGVSWYTSHFDPDCKVRVESSPNYTAVPFGRGAMARMAEVVPDARLIYLVRDPLDRMASHWVHNEYRGRHDPERSLREVLLEEGATYLSRSQYAMQLELLCEHYSNDRILVLTQEQLLDDRAATMRRVFEFLDLDA